MADDQFMQLGNLRADLLRGGYPAWADELGEHIAAGSTGTEILMSLRWTLRRFLAQPDLPVLLRETAQRVHDSIDGAL